MKSAKEMAAARPQQASIPARASVPSLVADVHAVHSPKTEEVHYLLPSKFAPQNPAAVQAAAEGKSAVPIVASKAQPLKSDDARVGTVPAVHRCQEAKVARFKQLEQPPPPQIEKYPLRKDSKGDFKVPQTGLEKRRKSSLQQKQTNISPLVPAGLPRLGHRGSSARELKAAMPLSPMAQRAKAVSFRDEKVDLGMKKPTSGFRRDRDDYRNAEYPVSPHPPPPLPVTKSNILADLRPKAAPAGEMFDPFQQPSRSGGPGCVPTAGSSGPTIPSSIFKKHDFSPPGHVAHLPLQAVAKRPLAMETNDERFAFAKLACLAALLLLIAGTSLLGIYIFNSKGDRPTAYVPSSDSTLSRDNNATDFIPGHPITYEMENESRLNRTHYDRYSTHQMNSTESEDVESTDQRESTSESVISTNERYASIYSAVK